MSMAMEVVAAAAEPVAVTVAVEAIVIVIDMPSMILACDALRWVAVGVAACVWR